MSKRIVEQIASAARHTLGSSAFVLAQPKLGNRIAVTVKAADRDALREKLRDVHATLAEVAGDFGYGLNFYGEQVRTQERNASVCREQFEVVTDDGDVFLASLSGR